MSVKSRTYLILLLKKWKIAFFILKLKKKYKILPCISKRKTTCTHYVHVYILPLCSKSSLYKYLYSLKKTFFDFRIHLCKMCTKRYFSGSRSTGTINIFKKKRMYMDIVAFLLINRMPKGGGITLHEAREITSETHPGSHSWRSRTKEMRDAGKEIFP